MFINQQAGLICCNLDGEFIDNMCDNTLEFSYEHEAAFLDKDVFMFGDYDLDMVFCGC